MYIIPSTVGLFVLATPIIQYLFEYGKWTAESTAAVAAAIMIQVLVLPAMMTRQIYTKTLYAANDIKTPVRIGIISLALATILYISLFPLVGYLAMPIGIVISGYIKSFLLYRICRKKGLFKY